LGASLQSILDQTGVNLEVILVNDPSTDRTGQVADAVGRAHRRLRVLHDPLLPAGWLGKASATHRAATNASGEYLLSPPRLATKQLPSVTEFRPNFGRDLHSAVPTYLHAH
jgi:glycosyltransferase involved in cell wall biosynthesis